MRVAGVAAISTALAFGPGGCRSAGRGLADDDPAYKVPAIKRAASADQATATPQLVASLDDDDAAVRFYAVEAPTDATLRPGGLGLPCLKRLLDEAVFEPQPDGMRLRMVKTKRPAVHDPSR